MNIFLNMMHMLYTGYLRCVQYAASNQQFCTVDEAAAAGSDATTTGLNYVYLASSTKFRPGYITFHFFRI